MILQVIGMAIQQSLMSKQKELKVSDLKNLEVSKDFEHFNSIIELFKDESVSDAIEILDGLHTTIKGSIREENQKRKLDTLIVGLLDY